MPPMLLLTLAFSIGTIVVARIFYFHGKNAALEELNHDLRKLDTILQQKEVK